ncbi:hypothetical protein [Nitrosomonas sp. PY1]|nr:hypothetical protein [Nitrosomonas sp. PY1]
MEAGLYAVPGRHGCAIRLHQARNTSTKWQDRTSHGTDHAEVSSY